MNQYMIPQKALASREEMKETVYDRMDFVVCPKPRRPGFLDQGVNATVRLRRHVRYQEKFCDAEEDADVLDFILSKGGIGITDQVSSPVASSPPYFCGSPPSRAANPIVNDAHFGKKFVSPPPIQVGLPLGPQSAASPQKGCARATHGLKPAVVRIEGFNCLDRDAQNRRVPAMA